MPPLRNALDQLLMVVDGRIYSFFASIFPEIFVVGRVLKLDLPNMPGLPGDNPNRSHHDFGSDPRIDNRDIRQVDGPSIDRWR